MVEICLFNPNSDISSVEQFGFVDLPVVLASGVLPASVSGDEGKYNDIESPGEVLCRPRDVFDVAHLERSIRDYRPATDKENPA